MRAESATCDACGERVHPVAGLEEHGCHRCERCGVVVCLPFPERTAIESQYDTDYFRNLDQAGVLAEKVDSYRAFALAMRRVLGPGAAVFEIGCGTGALLRALSDVGLAARGVDISAGAVRMARELLGTDATVGNATAIEVPHGTNAVVALHVIEHLESPREFLRAIRAQLRPSDWVIVEVPDFGARMRAQLGPAWPHFRPGEHLYHFDERSLGHLLTACGFDPRRRERLGGFGLLQPPGTVGVADPGDTPELPGWRERVYRLRKHIYRFPPARRAVRYTNARLGYDLLHRNQSIRVWGQAR